MDITKALKECYEGNSSNFFIRDNPTSDNDFCYIYFSSNALYRKNDFDDFETKIVQGNRYEWLQLSAINKPRREIFVRDIYLSWYVRGINQYYPSYKATIDLLREKSGGGVYHSLRRCIIRWIYCSYCCNGIKSRDMLFILRAIFVRKSF